MSMMSVPKSIEIDEDNQQLLELLTDTDSTGDLAESAKNIEEDRKETKFSASRWTARLGTLSVILGKYVQILRTLEINIPRLHCACRVN